MASPELMLSDDPRWYKDAVFYELRVRSFYDSDGDGIGDFRGLTEKLDYLQNLGVTALWLLPFYPSPLRDDGYDISDYTDIHADCGTLHDFKRFLKEAHRRGLRVITELVVNHTSDQHPWFQRARRSPPGSRYRDFYIWSDSAEKFKEARIIFQDFEPSNWSWDPQAHAYYFHRFYAHQPDLNYDNPEVRRATLAALDFWFSMGVDGMRLDAVPYLYKREGTSCENLHETHAFLQEMRAHVDRKFPNRMFLAEANQWPEDAVAYLSATECHMAFHFPLMPRIFMSVRMEDRFPLVDIWNQTPPIDETCQWALFLRNHDELTLEMVTEEEREYMYRAYAQESRMRLNLGIRRRLAPLLGNNRRTIELVNALLLSMPGTPVVYYGDEIGMGDNVYLGDRDGVRTPMQWSGDRNAGFSNANPQQLILPVTIDHEYHYQTVNVEAQDRNRHSLLWWMRRMIALRKQYQAFGRGTMELLSPENARVLAFVRSYGDERILVVANLSRFVQYVELDLSRFRGMVPVELIGRTAFPPIGEQPYFLSLGPHNFDWFALEPPRKETIELVAAAASTPHLTASGSWESFIRGEGRALIEPALTTYLPRARWFRSKARNVKTAVIKDLIPIHEASGAMLALVAVEFTYGEVETYVIPIAWAEGDRAVELRTRSPQRAIAELRLRGRNGGADGLVYDAGADPEFCHALLSLMDRRRHLRGEQGELRVGQTAAWPGIRESLDSNTEVKAIRAEQSNFSMVFGDRLILKMFRRLDRGLNPDLEVGRFLTERASFPHTPPLAGWLEYHSGREEPRTMAVLHGFVPNQGDAWEYTGRELTRYFERAVTKKDTNLGLSNRPLVELITEQEPSTAVRDLIGAYLGVAGLLGRRTAELHLALAADSEDPAFAPEPYSTLYQRSAYQSMRNLLGQVLRHVRSRLDSVAPELQAPLQRLLASQERINGHFGAFIGRRFNILRTRCHGDLHLGQILHTGKDFMIIDFEGEPARSLDDRRRKRSPLRDVAGMLRSFHYASLVGLFERLSSGALGSNGFQAMEPWARLWQTWCSWAYLDGYLKIAGHAPFVPADREDLRVMLDALLLEKGIYEVGYELNNRPDWLRVPLHGIEQILGTEANGAG
ncbi:MAG TPA: maltose alpha-D-glucosyltransferase [Candidatus Binataceae bacterium]|nr:maltose alpha-D-glucosyltransferase [Candidatus Binataceae bacterium]